MLDWYGLDDRRGFVVDPYGRGADGRGQRAEKEAAGGAWAADGLSEQDQDPGRRSAPARGQAAGGTRIHTQSTARTKGTHHTQQSVSIRRALLQQKVRITHNKVYPYTKAIHIGAKFEDDGKVYKWKNISWK